LKLPAPLAHLANRPHGRHRLSCPVRFTHRADEWAAQVASGAVRYDIAYQLDRGRWYLSASWTRPAPPAVTLQEAVAGGVLAVDLNAGHLACWQIDPDGNPVGVGVDIPMVLDGLPASTRDGRLRGAISTLLERSPGITPPAWCSGVARSACERGDGQVCPHPTGGWKPPGRSRLVRRATGQAAPTPGCVQGTTRPRPTPAGPTQEHKTGSGDRARARVQVAQDRLVPSISAADRR